MLRSPCHARIAAPLVRSRLSPGGRFFALDGRTGYVLPERTVTLSVMRRALALVLTLVVTTGCGLLRTPPRGDASGRPNIIFVATEDLDLASLDHLPKLRSLLAQQGATFSNAFVNVALSSPSRATMLRGQYAHDTAVYTNASPDGGFAAFHSQGLEGSTVATWLHGAGYHTALLGKYLTGYPSGSRMTFVPPGWDDWVSPVGGDPYSAFGYQLNENGRVVQYGSAARDYLTDVLARKSAELIRASARDAARRPLFMLLSPYAPHSPAVPAPRHAGAFADATAPRTASFDEAEVSDKPAWVRALPRIAVERQTVLDTLYRDRLASMLAVEDLVQTLVDTLSETGQLDRTYLFFTSANGFHLGQHRLESGKGTGYDEDIRVPLLVRGPGIPANVTREHYVLDTDYAPTFADLAGIAPASYVDGRSLVPLLREDAPSPQTWRKAVLLEHGMTTRRPRPSRSPGPSASPEPSDMGPASASVPAFRGIRTGRYAYLEYVTGEHELYDLNMDPAELRNLYDEADPGLLGQLAAQLGALKDCREAACRPAEDR